MRRPGRSGPRHGPPSGVIHVVAFLALATVYLNKMSSIWGALLVFAISTVLYLELLDVGVLRPAIRVLFALTGGWLMAQCLLMVNWWPTYGWTGGAVLLVCFFAVCGILTAHSERVMVVGGEWFSMWQSKDWNAQEAAYRFYMAVLGVLIFVSLPDGDLPKGST